MRYFRFVVQHVVKYQFQKGIFMFRFFFRCIKKKGSKLSLKYRTTAGGYSGRAGCGSFSGGGEHRTATGCCTYSACRYRFGGGSYRLRLGGPGDRGGGPGRWRTTGPEPTQPCWAGSYCALVFQTMYQSNSGLRWQGRAGKTALARALSGEGFEDTASTVGVEQRLMEVTPAALDVLGAAGVWRRAEGCDSTGAISAAAAAAQLAARKLASRQLPTALGAARAGAVVVGPGMAGGEISELLEGMDGGGHYGAVERASGELPPLHEQRPPPQREPLAAPTGGGGPPGAGRGRVGDDGLGREPDFALSAMDRELVLKLARDEDAGNTAGLRLSLWDYGGQKVKHINTHTFTCTHAACAFSLLPDPVKTRAHDDRSEWICCLMSSPTTCSSALGLRYCLCEHMLTSACLRLAGVLRTASPVPDALCGVRCDIQYGGMSIASCAAVCVCVRACIHIYLKSLMDYFFSHLAMWGRCTRRQK